MAEPIPAHSSPLRFSVLFLFLVVALQVLAAFGPLETFFQGPLCDLIARLSGGLLAPFGQVVVDGNRLAFDGFWVVVVEACNGVLPTTIFLAAVFAFPASWRSRAVGILLGVPGIFLINLIRVASLVVLGAHWPSLFEHVHLYVWQSLVVLLSMGLWIFWIEYFVRPGGRFGVGA